VTETPETNLSRADYLELVDSLEFQIDAGVNIFLEAEPVNRFDHQPSKETVEPNLQFNSSIPSPSDSAPVFEPQGRKDEKSSYNLPEPRPLVPAVLRENISEAGDISAAESAALRADTLEELKQAIEAFEGCTLKRAAKNTVFADGNPVAKIMLVGEAPGRDEDREGKPFIGRSGKLLDRMFAAIGLDRNDIYITNLVPWRPTGNRTPTPDETALCRPFLLRHIELVQPDILVLVGGVSAKEMLDSSLGITKLRGTWQDLNIKGRDIPALPILHPAYLLRNPARKAETWQDLCSLQKKLSHSSPAHAANNSANHIGGTG